MKYLILGLLFVTTPVLAQQAQVVFVEPLETASQAVAEDTPLEITTSLLMSEEGRAALEDFHSRKASGAIPNLNKSSKSYEVGATVLFWVRNVATNQFEQREFTLQHDDTNFAIWVETEQVNNGNVRAFTLQFHLIVHCVMIPQRTR